VLLGPSWGTHQKLGELFMNTLGIESSMTNHNVYQKNSKPSKFLFGLTNM
jgi:hypothetical protein